MRMPERRHQPRRLTTRLLLTISVVSLVAVALVSSFTFSSAYQRTLESRLYALKTHSLSRVQQESWPFEQAASNTQLLADAFLQSYLDHLNNPATLETFARWVEPIDGIHRLKPALATGYSDGNYRIEHVSGFFGHYEHAYSDELKARVVSATRTLARFAPAWQADFANTHISMPENVLLHHSVDHHWGLLASSDLDIRQGAVVASTLQHNNPERQPAWTGLYYDESAEYWAVTYQRPIDYQGEHLITPSHDLYLSSIIARLIKPRLEHTRHFLFNRQAQLIARPDNLPDEKRFAGVLHVDRLDSNFYRNLYQHIAQNAPSLEQPVIELGTHEGELMIATHFAEPDWWYVTAYSERALQQRALLAAIAQVTQGVVILLVILLIVYLMIRKQVSLPLRRLVQVTEMVSNGQFAAASSSTEQNHAAKHEIGLLNRTLGDMARRIEADQKSLNERIEKRTKELAEANARLDALVHVDGLTGALNRRALDRDLQLAVDAAQPFAMILCDVDFFKAYNDNQGHLAGDKVLQQIVATLKATSEAKVYRYGGEEIAILCHTFNGIEDCIELAERLRKAIEALDIPHPEGVNQCVTISAGVGVYQVGQNSEDVMKSADQGLYKAKQQGRNQVAVVNSII